MNYIIKIGVTVMAIWRLTPMAKRQLVMLYKWWAMHSSVTVVSKNLVMLPYMFRGKHYKILIPIARGPSRVRQVFNQIHRDVTDQVKEYMGPNEDFHGFNPSPSMMGYDELHITFSDAEDKSFMANDIIKL
jgi:hypothetical protein